MKFNIRLKELREEKGIMQKDLARVIGVKPPRISEWEAGKTRPVYEDLINLAKFFKVTTDYLLGVEE